MINYIALSWSVSRGQETYGYNICRLDDRNNGKRYRCMGGGYDMVGTVIGEWLADVYQSELLAIAEKAGSVYSKASGYISKLDERGYPDNAFLYGMTYYPDENRVSIDGACGVSSVIAIGNAIGLSFQNDWNKRANRGYGATVGYFVSMEKQRVG